MVRLLRSIVGLVLAIPAGRGSSALGFANQQPVIPPHTFSSFLQGRKAAPSSAPGSFHGDVSLSQASQGAQPPQPYLAQREVQAAAGYVSSVTSFRQLRGLSLEAGRAVLEELVLPAHGDDSCRWHLLGRTL